MHRRDLLKGATASVGAAFLEMPAVAASSSADLSGDLSVTVSQNGRALTYSQSAGTDLGDFVAPGFVQRCIRVDQGDSPLTIFFRPDRNSERVEVVFELGRMWGAANKRASHMGRYTATIRKGQRVLATVVAPNHWWFSRWRWQSSARPVVRTAKDLIEGKLLLPYSADASAFAEKPEPAGPATYEHPMDSAGIQIQLGTSGDRPDIGPVTDYQADYLITGSVASLAILRAQAEAAASIPIHLRDEVTSAPVDFFRHPNVSWYDEPNGEPWVRPYSTIVGADGKNACPWELSTSHDPALNYVPYLLTGDPYHLEELQFQGGQPLGWTSYHRSETGLQVVFPDDARSYAWSMRTIFQLAKITPESVPRWLQPRAYWKRIADDNLKWFTANFVNESSPACSVFHSATGLENLQAWQEDFLATVLGWAVLMGFEDWRRAYRWKLESTLARTNGRSGWPRQWCTPFSVRIYKSEPADFVYARKSPSSIWQKSWATAWESYRANPTKGVKLPFPDTVSWAQKDDPQLLLYTRGALALATHLGIEEAREPFEFVDRMAAKNKFTYYKWSIAPAQSRNP